MNSTEIVELFRDTVADTAAPFLWSDEEAFRFLDDAQKTFCRETGGLGDASSSLTQVAYTTASDWVALDPRILHVLDATDLATGKPIEVTDLQGMRADGLRFNNVPGRVRRVVIGLEPKKLRLHPFPADAGTIQLAVDRLPLDAITDAGDQELEVDEQHHQRLIEWMMHRAYSKQDAETYDKRKADAFKASFLAYCFEAKAERERARGKIRVVRYAGI